jgi:type II secretory pathway pseudopilin PulG
MQTPSRPGSTRCRPPLRRRRGFSLVELLTGITILVFGIGALVSLVATTTAASRLNRETALALSAAQGTLERMRGEPFEQLFARYNQDASDDPAGPGSAPGADSAVPGLDPQPGDADGMALEIVLPAVGPELFEDEAVALFSLPRDLDMDGTVDAADHAGDYRVLPVLVRVSWRGRTGSRTIQLLTTIADL